MILPEADELLAPVMAIDGFRLGCLIDASTGMVLASAESQDGHATQAAAAGAADIIHVLTLLSGTLATGERAEDVIVTFSESFFMVRSIERDQEPQILLVVMVDRQQTNLALAHRSIRDFCARFTA